MYLRPYKWPSPHAPCRLPLNHERPTAPIWIIAIQPVLCFAARAISQFLNQWFSRDGHIDIASLDHRLLEHVNCAFLILSSMVKLDYPKGLAINLHFLSKAVNGRWTCFVLEEYLACNDRNGLHGHVPIRKPHEALTCGDGSPAQEKVVCYRALTFGDSSPGKAGNCHRNSEIFQNNNQLMPTRMKHILGFLPALVVDLSLRPGPCYAHIEIASPRVLHEHEEAMRRHAMFRRQLDLRWKLTLCHRERNDFAA